MRTINVDRRVVSYKVGKTYTKIKDGTKTFIIKTEELGHEVQLLCECGSYCGYDTRYRIGVSPRDVIRYIIEQS